MIEELAIYENMLDQCKMTASKLKTDYQEKGLDFHANLIL